MADTPQEEPQTGGSYVRNPDGTLTRVAGTQGRGGHDQDESIPEED